MRVTLCGCYLLYILFVFFIIGKSHSSIITQSEASNESLTLQSQTKQFTKSHSLECVIVDGECSASDTYELLPVASAHGRVAQVINEWQTGLHAITY